MSMINVDDLQRVLPGEILQVSHQINDTVISQQTQTNVQMNTQIMENCSSYSTMIPSFKNIDRKKEGIVIYGPRYNPQSSIGNIIDVQEYTTWSIFNIIFCCIFIGGCAFYISRSTRKKKHMGDIIRAKNLSKLTAILNIIATISGIIIYIIVGLTLSGYIYI